MSFNITVCWADMKNFITSKSLSLQYINVNGLYYLYAFDGPFSLQCIIAQSSPESSDQTDFETNFMPASNRPIVPKNADGKQITIHEKIDYPKFTFYSHNWADPTTWYMTAQLISNETPTNSGDNTTYVLANKNVIDTYHGKLTGEDLLKDSSGNSYRVSVSVDGYAKVEQDPHYGVGGDFLVDYDDGYIIFNYALNPTDTVLVTYHKMVDSTFIIKPRTGTKLVIMSAEIQFSTDIIVNDTAQFQPYGFVDHFAPQLIPAIPPGTIIPLGSPTIYKSMSDYQNDANKSYPIYPPLGGPSWRGLNVPIVVFDWDYTAATPIRADYGMEVRIKLQHDVPFGGTYGTATFYCVYENL